MKPLNTLLASTILAAATAIPAAALEVDSDASMTINGSAAATANPGLASDSAAEMNAEIEGTATTEEAATAEASIPSDIETLPANPDSDFIGNTVVSLEGVTLGTISDVRVAESGMQVLCADIDASSVGTSGTACMQVSQDAVADGEIKLALSADEFREKVGAHTDQN